MKEVIRRTISEATAIISKNQVTAKVCLTLDMVSDGLDKLRGAVMIVYPMNLPPYDPIRLEFEGQEDLSGTQVTTLNTILTLTVYIPEHLISNYPELITH
jgi:hypothetical protein